MLEESSHRISNWSFSQPFILDLILEKGMPKSTCVVMLVPSNITMELSNVRKKEEGYN